MPQVTFEEIECKSALNRVNVPSMPDMRWSLNPYRGCQHACVYCFARGNHEYLGYNTGSDFDRRIVVKTNLVGVLRQELRRSGWRREPVTIGTACDPYQQAELKYGLTRGALQAFRDAASPCSLITKSPNIVRDLPVLCELSSVAECTILFSVATLREEVWRHLEPETAKPIRRLEAMAQLAEAGVRCGVLLALEDMRRVHVPEPAPDGNDLFRRLDARTGEFARGDRVTHGYGNVAACAHVAHRCEAQLEQFLRVDRSVDCRPLERAGELDRVRIGDVVIDEVGMSVDEPREDRLAGAVDHLVRGRCVVSRPDP